MTLRAGESFVTDRRDVEVLLLGITPSGAMFAVRSGGYEQRVTMGPGEIGSRTFDRYRLELVSTTMGAGVELARHGHGMATIVITKWR